MHLKLCISEGGRVVQRRRVQLEHPQLCDVQRSVGQYVAGEYYLTYVDDEGDTVALGSQPEWEECAAVAAEQGRSCVVLDVVVTDGSVAPPVLLKADEEAQQPQKKAKVQACAAAAARAIKQHGRQAVRREQELQAQETRSAAARSIQRVAQDRQTSGEHVLTFEAPRHRAAEKIQRMCRRMFRRRRERGAVATAEEVRAVEDAPQAAAWHTARQSSLRRLASAYPEAVEQLSDMGYTVDEFIVNSLHECDGDVTEVVEKVLKQERQVAEREERRRREAAEREEQRVVIEVAANAEALQEARARALAQQDVEAAAQRAEDEMWAQAGADVQRQGGARVGRKARRRQEEARQAGCAARRKLGDLRVKPTNARVLALVDANNDVYAAIAANNDLAEGLIESAMARYGQEFSQMVDMGYNLDGLTAYALLRCGGSVNLAIGDLQWGDRLLE